MNLSDLQRWISPLRTRVVNMVARAIVNSIDDSKKLQLAQIEILDGEVRDDVERVQNYGFTSVPKKGAEAVIVRVGGNADHGVIIAIDDRTYRLKGLGSGEVALYDAKGSMIVLKNTGNIEVTSNADAKVTAGGDVTIDGGTITLKGGSTPVAKEGSSTTGHLHTLSGTAGPYPVSGTAVLTTDSIASGAGSANVKVP